MIYFRGRRAEVSPRRFAPSARIEGLRYYEISCMPCNRMMPDAIHEHVEDDKLFYATLIVSHPLDIKNGKLTDDEIGIIISGYMSNLEEERCG